MQFSRSPSPINRICIRSPNGFVSLWSNYSTLIFSFLPDWLQPTFVLLPALLWLFFGVGIPWSLALLPRTDWSRRIEVLTLALILGPALTTTAMFVIGTVGHWTLANVLLSSGVITMIGLSLSIRKARLVSIPKIEPRSPLLMVDWALIVALVVVVLFHFWNTAYWPYDNFDEFWVYGYNAKIFAMQHAIPASIGYYPQLLPLSLTYGQLMWGAVSEHAARTVVPYFEMGSILITYVLGTRLFGRRSGLIGAAVWALYSHHAGWAQYADLEVPVTLYFTGAVAYFILAWRNAVQRTAYAVLAGIIAGAALWTKPTAGALIESGALIGISLIIWAIGRKRSYQAEHNTLWPRLGEALRILFGSPLPLFALALIPMGAMWYLRNILYGHPPLVLPAGYWQDAAQRSGQELGWPLLLLAILTAYLWRATSISRRNKRGLLAGLILMVAVSIPSAIDAHHLGVIEFALIGVGGALWAFSARPWWQAMAITNRTTIVLIYAFIIPYFVTWFWSYSYHYRLSFAFIPLFAVQIAVGMDRIGTPIVMTKRYRMVLATAAVLALAIPGWIASLSGWGTAITNALADDHAKHAVANPALMTLVDYLETHRPSADRPLHVEAAAELRLPFFFPTDDIRIIDYPTRLDQIADVDFFVDSSVGQQLYVYNGQFYNQILSSLTRIEVMKRQLTTDDHNFRYSIYTIDNQQRFNEVKPSGPINVQIGDFAILVGYDLSTLSNSPGEKIFLTLYWKALKPASLDYSVYIHFLNTTTQKLSNAWGGEPVSGAFSVWDKVPGAHFSDPYHTRLWQTGETIRDEWVLRTSPDTPLDKYNIRIGLFDPVSGLRLPVHIDGRSDSDGITLPAIISEE